MAFHILQPTVNTNPDQGGTLAVTTASNTGHASTNAASSATGLAPSGSQSVSQNKSCRWSSFPAAPGGTITSLRLKFTWAAQGSEVATPASDGVALASVSFVVEYSLNGGSNWTTAVSQTSASFNTGGNEDIALNVAQNTTQVQVRDRLDSSAFATAGTVDDSSASASVTGTVSGIQIEAVTAAVTANRGQLIVMM